MAIRKEMTAKMEGKCQELDDEIRNHEEFVAILFIEKTNDSDFLSFRQRARTVVQRLNDATRDITTATARTSLE